MKGEEGGVGGGGYKSRIWKKRRKEQKRSFRAKIDILLSAPFTSP